MSAEQVEVSKIPPCDLHAARGAGEVPAIVDGKTIYGPWAYMCAECFDLVGVGLGTGRGQLLVLRRS